MQHPQWPRYSTKIPALIRSCFDRCQSDPDMRASLAEKARKQFPFTDEWRICRDFIREVMPSGKVLFCGAGYAAQELVPSLQYDVPELNIVALVDREAKTIKERWGLPVRMAEEASRLDFDYVLVANLKHEASMVQDLLQVGIPLERIVSVYRHPEFKAYHDDKVKNRLLKPLISKIRNLVPHVEHLIIVPSRDLWQVVDEESLREVLPPEKTVRLFFGQPGQMDPSLYYPSFDLRRSILLLLGCIEALRPKSIYLRGSAHFQSQHLGALIRAKHPDIFLTFEGYDYMSTFDDEILEGWSFTQESIETNRLAEMLLGIDADFILDKTPGDGWNALLSELFTTPRQAYFPRLQSCSCASKSDKPFRNEYRLMCAGTMPEYKLYDPGVGYRNSAFQDIIGPLLILGQEPDLSIDIFNSGHECNNLHCDLVYEGYLRHFDPKRIHYYKMTPFDTLVGQMQDFDFGILLFTPSSLVIDYPLQESLPNRFMGYVCGDLPIIINKEVTYSASLVERFHAGITIAADEMEDLPRRIREADLGAMREGVKALHQFMLEHNGRAINVFKEVLAAHAEDVRS